MQIEILQPKGKERPVYVPKVGDLWKFAKEGEVYRCTSMSGIYVRSLRLSDFYPREYDKDFFNQHPAQRLVQVESLKLRVEDE